MVGGDQLAVEVGDLHAGHRATGRRDREVRDLDSEVLNLDFPAGPRLAKLAP